MEKLAVSEANLASLSEGYDLVAEFYDRWGWQAFWRANEFPLVLSRLGWEAPRRVLDLGTGTGAFIEQAARRVGDQICFVGIDISARMLMKARSRLGSGLALVRCDVREGLPFKRGAFDMVTMLRVANHIADLRKAISEISRVLSRDGLLVASDLAEEYDYTCTRIPTADGAVDIETHKHATDEWRDALSAEGFRDFNVDKYNYEKLSSPSAGGLKGKIDHTGAPIFRIITARKNRF